jgi:hypothetical protein
MKLFNKTAIALTLSLFGAVGSVSALAMATDNTQLQEVEIIVEGDTDKNMNVFLSVDGEITNVDVSPSAMSNPEALRELLSDVPEDVREKLIESLMNAQDDNGNFKVVVSGDVGISQELHQISGENNEVEHNIRVIDDSGENKVIVMEFDESNSGGYIAQKVIKEMVHSSVKPSHHRSVQVIHQGNMSAYSIMRMIKHSDFTAEELNKIQQVLDVKR